MDGVGEELGETPEQLAVRNGPALGMAEEGLAALPGIGSVPRLPAGLQTDPAPPSWRRVSAHRPGRTARRFATSRPAIPLERRLSARTAAMIAWPFAEG